MKSGKGAQIFDAVSEGSRREILDLLAAGPRGVGEIADATGLSQPNASRHLRSCVRPVWSSRGPKGSGGSTSSALPGSPS